MEAIEQLLGAQGGVLLRRQHRELDRQLDHCLRQGRLHALLPGVYTAAEPSWEVRIRAAAAYRPDGVLTGAAAARLSWWPDCPITAVSTALAHGRVAARRRGFAWERRSIPPDLVTFRDGVGMVRPALSVLDLIPALGGRVIDEALRRRAVLVPHLWNAFDLHPRRRGNDLRRTLLEDSRDSPWSEAERDAHRLLRSAGLTGFRTNRRVEAGDAVYCVDIAYPQPRVIVEIDGWKYHRGRGSFVQDRWRYSRLAAAGWAVLPLAAEALTTDPEAVVELVRTALVDRGWRPS